MPYEQVVKDRAYTLDPECWRTYSGKPRGIKRAMELRRVASLEKAQLEADKELG